MNINRHIIHLLLCDYDSFYKQHSRFFDREASDNTDWT